MPCDDPELIKVLPKGSTNEEQASKFWVYFHKNFKNLGIKKVIATHFDRTKSTYKIEYDGKGDDGDIMNFKKTNLHENGDFRSNEIQDLYKKIDVVITNPPFSLFREFILNLVKNNLKFLIIGNKNAIAYKEISKLIIDNKLWLGYSSPKKFLTISPQIGESSYVTEDLVGLTRWFTNLRVDYRYEKLILFKKYETESYPFYDGWKDIIEVSKVKNIPSNYYGLMGVPFTFLDKWNPVQFKIIDILSGYTFQGKKILYINGKKTFRRAIIQRIDKE